MLRLNSFGKLLSGWASLKGGSLFWDYSYWGTRAPGFDGDSPSKKVSHKNEHLFPASGTCILLMAGREIQEVEC